MRSAVAVLLGLSTGLTSAYARSGGEPRTRIDCKLDVERRTVEGIATLSLANPSDAFVERAYVWLYPNRFARRPSDLDDVNHHWYFPGRVDRGSMSMTAIEVAGRRLESASWRAEPHGRAGDGVLWSVALPSPLPPGEAVTLRITYRAKIPRQYGSFGCVDGACSLAGGFYPMLAHLDAAGWDLELGPRPGAIELRLALARPASVVAFGELIGDARVAFEARAARAAYASVFVAPRWYRTERRAGPVRARVFSRREPPPTEEARSQILPYTLEPYAAYAAELAGQSLVFARKLGANLVEPVALVEVPLRFDLAESHPGVTVVSDQWYRVWPAERIRKFHARELVRAVYATALEPMLLVRAGEGERDIPWLASLFAAYLTDLFTLARYQRRERAGEILAPFSFIPAVDQLLYDPQIMFSAAYFGGAAETNRAVPGPRGVASLRASGRRVYEALRDLLTPEALRDAMTASLVDGRSLEAAAEAVHGQPLGWWFRQWRQPAAAVDYQLAGVRTAWVAGVGFRHEIRVVRRVTGPGPVAREPVEIIAEDEGGGTHRLVWDGAGAATTLRLVTATPLRATRLDPRRRLAQHTPWDSAAHPLAGDQRPSRLRFVYNSFGVLLNVTDLSALLAADFSLSRAYDLRERLRLVVFSSASTTVGGAVSLVRSFGPKVTLDRLLSSTRWQLAVQRLRDDFFGGDGARAATRASASATSSASDRVFAYEPRRSRDASLGATLAVTRLDGDGERRAETGVTAQLGASYARLWTPTSGHTLGVEAGAAVVMGQLGQRSQLLTGGGVGGSRGYGPGELFGRLRFDLHLEYRHSFSHALSWNLGHYSILRGLGGAAFFDLVALSPEDGYGLEARRDLHPSLGYGLRVFYDSFGTLQQLLRLDVALRIDADSPACVRGRAAACPLPAVYLTFLPPF